MHPFIYHSDSLIIPSYWLIISLTYSAALLWLVRRARQLGYDHRMALDLSLMIMLGGFFGARLFHVFYEFPDYYLSDPWAIFRIWQGGFVFYGGVIGALVLCEILLIKRGEPFLKWADLFAPVAAAGYSVGRVGCYLGGCCFGTNCDMPWAVRFPEGVDAPAGIPIHPTQLYATFWEAAVVLILLSLEKRPKNAAGTIFLTWLILHGIGRLIMEHFRSDNRGPDLLGLSISSWLSLALILMGFFGMLWVRRKHASNNI